jgi:serine/threonine protein kinase
VRCPRCQAKNRGDAETCFQCGSAFYALTEGDLLSDRYEIQRTVGQGGMGIVYRARDRELDEIVALKTLRPRLFGSTTAIRRLQSEIKLARRVRHPGVCAIHEFGRHGQIPYIVMEYINGQDFKSLLRERGFLRQSEAYTAAVRICRALEAIHASGIVHRDLKTANIMLDARGQIRLMDFGIAKDTEGEDAKDSGIVLGTPEYMSPEQSSGEKIDFRSDIYALGTIIFELFTGQVPLRGGTPLETIQKQIHDEPDWDAASRRLPPDVLTILRRALAKKRNDRFASVRVMLAELEGARGDGMAEVDLLPSLAHASQATIVRPERAVPTIEPASVSLAAGVRSAVTTQAIGARRLNSRLIMAVGASLLAALVLSALWQASQHETDLSPAATMTPSIKEAASESYPLDTASTPLSDIEPRNTIARPNARSGSSSSEAQVAPTRSKSSMTQVLPPPIPVNGKLAFLVSPWAEITIDGTKYGTTPLRPVSISEGRHVVILRHPSYEPVRRVVTIQSGRLTKLEVDLTDVAFRRMPDSR